MQVKITGHGMEVTPAIRDYVFDKIGKLEEYFKNIQKVEVFLDARSTDNADKRQVAELRVWMGGLKMVQAEEGAKDMYAAFDLALAEASRQVEKHKEKLGHEKKREAQKAKIISRTKLTSPKETPEAGL